MALAWYAAAIAFLLLADGIVQNNAFALFFGGLWTYNCWKYQQAAFAKEEHDRQNRSGGEGFGG